MPLYALACFFFGTVLLVFARQIATRQVPVLQKWYVNRPWLTTSLSIRGQTIGLRITGIVLLVSGLLDLL